MKNIFEMAAWVAVLLTLINLTFLPVILVLLSKFEGNFFQKVESFVGGYAGILLSLGTLFLVSLLALLTTVITNRYSDQRYATNRQISTAVKLSDFRQVWINELRADLAEIITLTSESWKDDEQESNSRAMLLMSRILLRLNPGNEDIVKLRSTILDACDKALNDKVNLDVTTELLVLSQIILKREWDRLKTDLESARSTLEDTHQ